jgi:glycosyltransferase involved in cell wall biosynthesis
MRIALMLRTINDIDGPGVATASLVDKLLEIDRENEYLAIYVGRSNLGRYQSHSNVKEVCVPAGNKLVYDQFTVPRICHREKIGLIFHSKFSAPLLTSIPSIVIIRGAEYWTNPEWYSKADLFYARTMIPLYCRRARKVVVLSDQLGRDLLKFVKIPEEKVVTIYSAPNERFRPIQQSEYLEIVRGKYSLPEDQFVLSVTKPYSAVGAAQKGLYPRKNIEGIIDSFLSCRARIAEEWHRDVKLVLAGPRIRETLAEAFGAEFVDNQAFVFPGYIPQEDMPAVYSMASLLVFPSYSESFGLPLVEAMACGCPVVTSNAAACPEIVGEAAITCDPADIRGISDAMTILLTEPEAAQRYRERGLRRAAHFTWERSATMLKALFVNSEDMRP